MGLGFGWVGYGYGSWYPWVTQANILLFYLACNVQKGMVTLGAPSHREASIPLMLPFIQTTGEFHEAICVGMNQNSERMFHPLHALQIFWASYLEW